LRIRLISLGQVQLAGDRKGIEYATLSTEENTPDLENTLAFALKKNTNRGVGIIRSSETDGESYGKWKHEGYSDASWLNEYKVRHLATVQYFKHKALIKKVANNKTLIENMRIKDLRHFVKGNHRNKKLIRAYLMEFF